MDSLEQHCRAMYRERGRYFIGALQTGAFTIETADRRTSLFWIDTQAVGLAAGLETADRGLRSLLASAALMRRRSGLPPIIQKRGRPRAGDRHLLCTLASNAAYTIDLIGGGKHGAHVWMFDLNELREPRKYRDHEAEVGAFFADAHNRHAAERKAAENTLPEAWRQAAKAAHLRTRFGRALAVLAPDHDGAMQQHAQWQANSPKNNGPELLEAIERAPASRRGS